MIIPPELIKMKNAANIYVVLTDLGTMTGTDVVLVGQKDNELQPLYGVGDMYYEEPPLMWCTDLTQIWVKTSGGTAKVTVSGLSYPQIMKGVFI